MRLVFPLLLALCVLNLSCKEEDSPQPIDPVPSILTSSNVNLNPTGHAPLSAFLTLQTNAEMSLKVKVLGKASPQGDISITVDEVDDQFLIPVHGLYGDYENRIVIEGFQNGQSQGADTLLVRTQALHEDLPEIIIDKAHQTTDQTLLRFVNYFGFRNTVTPLNLFIYDQYGDIRWFLDFTDHPRFENLYFDNGPEILQNGNLLLSDLNNNGSLFEISLMGEVRSTYPLKISGYTFHHDITEMPNGNILLTANKLSNLTLEDAVIEIDRNTKAIVNEWDLSQSLEPIRYIFASPRSNPNIETDWFHGNGVTYSETDDCIIVSGRTQGVFKLTRNNELVWILTNHRGWTQERHTTKLLQPLDATGNPILDTDVLNGFTNHPSFEWNWAQHSPTLLPNSEILLFDNGEQRNYSNDIKYSRGVRYKIDEQNMTVQQTWSFGKDRGIDFFSPIVSNSITTLSGEHYLINSGSINNEVDFEEVSIPSGNNIYGKSIEVNPNNNQIIFESTLIAPNTFLDVTFHNIVDYRFPNQVE